MVYAEETADLTDEGFNWVPQKVANLVEYLFLNPSQETSEIQVYEYPIITSIANTLVYMPETDLSCIPPESASPCTSIAPASSPSIVESITAIVPQSTFLESLNNVPMAEKVRQINIYVFDLINDHLRSRPGVRVSELKKIINDVLLNDAVVSLWNDPSEEAYRIRKAIVSANKAVLGSISEISTQVVIKHLITQVVLLPAAHKIGADPTAIILLSNEKLYNSILNKF